MKEQANKQHVLGNVDAGEDATARRLSSLRLDRRRFLVRSGALGTGVAIAPVAGAHSSPVISGMTCTPSSLPPGGGDVVVNATVSPDTVLLTLNGQPTSLPATVRLSQTSQVTLAAYLAPTTQSATVVVAPAPAAAYSLTSSGPIRNYSEFHDHVVDANGRILFASHGSNGAWAAGDNTIYAYDPVSDTVQVLYPGNGNREGWCATDNFVHFYIPGLNYWLQQWTCLFDLTSNTIVASNIVVAKAAKGISDGDTTPAFNDVFEAEGTLWKNWSAATPGMAAHDWCASQDVGIALGGYQGSHQIAALIWRNPDFPSRSSKPLRIKCVYLPLSSRHPDNPTRFGFPIRAQNGAKCRGDWLYVFGAICKADGLSLDGTQRRNIALRLNVAQFMATPADQRVPDSACERLPDMPIDPSIGDGFCGIPAVTYDPVRDRFFFWNYKAWEFDPVGNAYSDVTPIGYPSVAGWCVAFTNGAHYLSGGHRALDSYHYAYYLPAAPNSPPFTYGVPTYVDKGRFARIE